MYFLDNNSGISSMPPVGSMQSSTPRWFTEGGNGVPPSWPGADWFNIIQSELLDILSEAGIAPDKASHTQLVAAMKALFLSRKNPGADIKSDGQDAINAFLSNLGLDTALKQKQPLDATLTALAGLARSANKLPYFTGEDQMAVADLSAFIRAMLGKADAAAVLQYLGLGDAATKKVVTAATDTTAGRVPVVGWQGLGGDAIQPTDNDFNKLSPSGFIQGQTNSPVSPSLFMGFNARHGGAYQLTIVGRNKRYFAQTCEAGVFQGFDEFYHTGKKPSADDVGALPANGTAAAATKLATSRQINGVAFDGSKNINLPLIGYGQSWQVFTDRAANTTYTNSTGVPIFVSVTVTMGTGNNAAIASLNINGVLIQSSVSRYSENNKIVFVSAIIPAGATYSVSGVQGAISTWAELR